MAITFTPKVGDVISQPKDGLGGSIVQHKILCVGNNEFIHNHPSTGVACIDEHKIDYKNGTVDRFKGSEEDRAKIPAAAAAKIGAPYHANNSNCEHLVNELRNGKAESPQVEFANNAANVALVVGATVGIGTAIALYCDKIKSNTTKWVWAILALVLLLVGGGIKFFLHTIKSPA